MRDVLIDKVLVLSTSHVRESTGDAFDKKKDDIPAALVWEHGWMVWVDDMWEPFASEKKELDAIAGGTAPPYWELGAIFALAKQHGCHWVRFDSDADAIEGLRTWEW